MTDTVYVCSKGHRFTGRTSLMVTGETPCVEAMQYAGDYCTVCYFAWIAQNVPRVEAVEIEGVPDA